MSKKKIKYGIAVISILIVIIITAVVLNRKNITTSSIFGQTPTALEGTETVATEDGDRETYNTFGEDSANYVDGDVNGEKSHWVKDGDTWTYTFYVDDPNAQWYIWEDADTLMDGFSGDYTESNVGTSFTEETLTEFTPDDTKMQSKEIEGKTVYTWLDNENAYKVTDNGDGTFTKITTKLSFTITNTQEGQQAIVETGSLTINKVVKDSEGNVLTEADDNTRFQFTITLSAGSADSKLIEGTKSFGNVIFKNKVASVALKAGGSITIPHLPEGVTYIITEQTASGYDTEYDSNSGTITKDNESTSTFTNTKQPAPTSTSGSETETPDDPDQEYVDIAIKKSVTGNNEVDEEYTIEVELNNLTASKTYQLSDGTSFKSDSEGSANVSIKLSNNESVTLKDIPVGAKYKAFEYAGDYISSYVITDSNNLGSIANTANSNTKTNVAISTGTETADEGENVTITFTNKKIVTQNLKIQKAVTDEENKNSYSFDIEFANMDEGSSFNSTVGKVVAEPNGKANLTIFLAGGESAEFYGIPVGTTYRIKEQASNAVASYTIKDTNNGTNIVNASAANTVAKKELSTEVETVNQGEEAVVTFTNDTSVLEDLSITKNVVNKAGGKVENCNEIFTFELKAENEANPMPEKTEVTVEGNGDVSFGKIRFYKGGVYKYIITEKAGNNDDYEYDTSVFIVAFNVTSVDGELQVSKAIVQDLFQADNVIFTNTLYKFNVEIQKTDDKLNSLNGAALQLLDSNKNVIKEWVAGDNEENPLVLKLEAGEYTLHELQAPEGYDLAEDVKFVLNGDGSISVNGEIVEKVVMKDPEHKEEPTKPEDPSDNKGEEKEPTKPSDEKPTEEKPDEREPEQYYEPEEEKQEEPVDPNLVKDASRDPNGEKDNKSNEAQNGTKDGTKDENAKEAQTGDNIIAYVAIFAVAMLGLIVIVRKKK